MNTEMLCELIERYRLDGRQRELFERFIRYQAACRTARNEFLARYFAAWAHVVGQELSSETINALRDYNRATQP